MIYLKIVTQILTGVSGLLALLLDYKWHDKRRKIFKHLRNALVLLTIFSLMAGVLITYYDEQDKNGEIGTLKSKLDSASNTLAYVKSNSDTLKLQIKPFLDLATSKYPNLNSSKALEKLHERIDSLDAQVSIGTKRIGALSSELTVEKKTIKSFSASVYIEFSGEWNGNPYPTWSEPPKCETYMIWSDTTGKMADIEFCSPKINFKTLDSRTGVFENILTVQQGNVPLGQLDDVLLSYNKMRCWLVFSFPKNLLSSLIVTSKIRIAYLINGSKRGELVSNERLTVDLKDRMNESVINPELSLNGKLVKWFNIRVD
ncbi:hypothetical protein [Pseudochryseolinea flava]|uniref:Uncharacterized protein n=1 Tax=Pseudochryseolinea flava TaxID=2059302 RepID=A0A364Y2Y1_9BACT|nr:hypothetical protein [Pseudochryseolinea flava]RAW01245.1 hypothetical protein DQQ10_10050 [Pseudochryseolinea flava]